MKLARFVLGAVGISAGLISCASASTQTSSSNERVLATMEVGTVRSHDANAADSTIEATPDVVFSALAAAYQDLGIEVKFINSATRQVGNKRFSKMYDLGGVRLSKYVGCGSTETGPAADNYRVTMSIVSQVTPSGTGSRVSTQLTAYAQDLGSSKGTLSCLTLGALEQRINQLTLKHIGG
jgi:hypothetical protein